MKQFYFFIPLLSIALSSLFCGNTENATARFESASTPDDSIKATGAIAYIRGGSEIRLIDPNGQNDRQIWTHSNAKEPLGLFDLAWRPDGKELAFSSAHEALFSVYHADIYSIRPDGSGYRKITNAPDHKSRNKFKTGTVTVTVRNNQYTFQQAQSSEGIFIINIIGAEEPQQVLLPPGSSKTLTFKNVADYGNHAQAIVAIIGNYRWFMPGTDVVAGKNTKAPDMIISGDGYEYFGAFRPVWNREGTEISYRDGVCLVKTIPANPPVGEMYFKPLFKENPLGSCVWDLGPTTSLADRVLYSENNNEEGSGFYLARQGGMHDPSTRLAMFSNIQYQIPHDVKWLPDGSGFLYSTTNLMDDASDIFHFDISSKQTRNITNLEGSFARRFSVSPDGKRIVYERSALKDDYEDVDLWIINLNGSGNKLLVKKGLGPSWSR